MILRKQKGLTLIEVLISMLLLSIGILALISLITNVLVASHQADQGALMRLMATDIQERAWIHSSVNDDCNDASSMANLNAWSDHPVLDIEAMPPATLSLRDDSGCVLTISPQGTMDAVEYRVTGPKGESL